MLRWRSLSFESLRFRARLSMKVEVLVELVG